LNTDSCTEINRIELLDGHTLKEMFLFATEWFAKSESDVNVLNVFPVPDGDTGTNMLLTMRSCMDETCKVTDTSVPSIIKAMAFGSFMGARGNSGVILSQIWRGIERSLRERERINGKDLAESFQHASVTAYEGLDKPVEGTILTVMKEIAAATNIYLNNGNSAVEEVLETAVDAAGKAVANTPNLLPILREAGVVDSGGQGLYILLEGALMYLKGQTDQLRSKKSKIFRSSCEKSQGKEKNQRQSLVLFEENNISPSIAVVAVATGDGIIDVFRKIGAAAVVSGGKTMNPSAQDILRAIEGIQSHQIIILPNDKNVVLIAKQVALAAGDNVYVIPTVTIPQGISSLLAFNPQADFKTNINLMTESRTLVKTIEVTRATRSSRVNGFNIQKDQAIGLLDGKLAAVGDRYSDAVNDILTKIDLADAETVSIFRRNGYGKNDIAKITDMMLRLNPKLNIEVLHGGQPLYEFLISVE
jgi:uncharacterized protein